MAKNFGNPQSLGRPVVVESKGGASGSVFGGEKQEEIVGSKLENHLPNSRGKPFGP